ncbi:MAG: DNA-binding transcriptional regulator [Syntrophomonadaceae bacterium]|jgi:TrpR-related protein YerC/YecD|nr:DNA-binding transcriptional regulator [Syntrophomonadaceae bacterium]
MAFIPKWKDKNTDLLVKTLLSLKDAEDVNRLLDDLCTVSEIKAMAQRIYVAQLLADNTTYNTIAVKTGASTATISRVKRCLNYGSGGYEKALQSITEEVDDEK